MRLADFDAMVRRLAADIPTRFFDGVAEVVVSPRAVPHPTRDDIYTLGECIPIPVGEGAGVDEVQSRIVLYHGSFQALAQISGDFDWRSEAWETLGHELRHHLEWRARAPTLEAFDHAVEQNFARHDGEPFDSTFYLDGDSPTPGVYQVEDDYFLDHIVRDAPVELDFAWRGRCYRIAIPAGASLPAFLIVSEVADPPSGELIVVLRRKSGMRDLFRPSALFQGSVTASPVPC